MKLKKLFEKYEIVFALFLIGSFLGFIIENVWTIIKGHFILRRGLIYSPLIPIYGIGALAYYFVYNNLLFKRENKVTYILKIFLIGFALGGIVEYFCSYFQESIFGTVSWEYSKMRFNLNGRISLFHSVCWGLLGIVFYKFIIPFFKRQMKYLANKKVKIVIIILSLLLLCDCTISYLACHRETERRNNIPATNSLEKYLDKQYTDEFIHQIYNNSRPVKKA